MAHAPERDSYFPAIEKKYGQPMSYWFDQMAERKALKYPEQIEFLREEHGFSQAHANALVMYLRGSVSTKRFSSYDDYLAHLDDAKRATISAIFDFIAAEFPQLTRVIAWNQPMVKNGDDYIFGVSAASKHLLISPYNADVLAELAPQWSGYTVLKKTIRIPVDWRIDTALLRAMITRSLQ